MRKRVVFVEHVHFFVEEVSNTRREISLFIKGDSMPFRPRHGRVHQSPWIDEDTEQWPCCGPIKSHRLWHSSLTLATGNENYSSDSLLFLSLLSSIKLSHKTCHCSGIVPLQYWFRRVEFKTPMQACPWTGMIAFKMLCVLFEGIWLIIRASTLTIPKRLPWLMCLLWGWCWRVKCIITKSVGLFFLFSFSSSLKASWIFCIAGPRQSLLRAHTSVFRDLILYRRQCQYTRRNID